MDIPRKGAARSRLIRRIIVSVVVVGALSGITFVVKGMKPAAQSVERSTVWPDTVKRGEMIRNVRGLGTLVPEDIVSIPATTDGRVERKLLAGIQVKSETVLLELTNPELQAATVDAEWQGQFPEGAHHHPQVGLRRPPPP